MTTARTTKAKKAEKPYALPAGSALVLRTCDENLRSHGEFQWPKVGEVATATDWKKNKECGQGLHGWLYGQGDHSISNYLDATSKWLVVEVEEAGIIMLGGKCKFKSGIVRFIGDKKAATDFLMANEPRSGSVAVIGASIEVGDGGSALAGALSTLTGGYSSTLTGGNRSTLTGGNRSTLTGGDSSTLTGGNRSTLCIKYWDPKGDRYRIKYAEVGIDGIKPNVAYRLDESFKFVAVVP